MSFNSVKFSTKKKNRIADLGSFYPEDMEILSEVLQEYLIRYYQLREQMDMYDMRINELAQAEPYRQKVEKLGCFRGIAAHTALSFCVEVGDFRRFATAQQLVAYGQSLQALAATACGY